MPDGVEPAADFRSIAASGLEAIHGGAVAGAASCLETTDDATDAAAPFGRDVAQEGVAAVADSIIWVSNSGAATVAASDLGALEVGLAGLPAGGIGAEGTGGVGVAMDGVGVGGAVNTGRGASNGANTGASAADNMDGDASLELEVV